MLIHAGAGGVGHIAIQLAKARGAYVITTASKSSASFLKVRAAGWFCVQTALQQHSAQAASRAWALMRSWTIMPQTLVRRCNLTRWTWSWTLWEVWPL